ncbi:hypothetical protein BDN72DRAFT_207308 [Pluteus cervinus]|uniref:Uncharacterized protein n=1 Tax=Pluteus cervinus TaxID=181527 RepID=A0ACD3AK56_9AGAR|nr:hypothetical protein BDN72DRAFT_207308 [Pluteus cervinus]
MRTSSVTSLSPFPHLPEDLEREIFEVTARHSRPDAITLSTLSKTLRSWIISILFESAFFANELPHPKPQELFVRYGHCIRHLALCIFSPEDVEYLAYTPNVVDLAVCGGMGDLPVLPALAEYVSKMPLRRLHIDISLLGPLAGSVPVEHHWQKITHFDGSTCMKSWTTPWPEFLISLPQLTHLSVRDGCSYQTIQSILAECKTLQVLVLRKMWFYGYGCTANRRVVFVPDEHSEMDPNGYLKATKDRHWCGDDRVVVVDCGLDYLRSWQVGLKGEEEMWAIAERIVGQRKQESDGS